MSKILKDKRWCHSLDNWEVTYPLYGEATKVIFSREYIQAFTTYLEELRESTQDFKDCLIVSKLDTKHFKKGWEVHPMHLNIDIVEVFYGELRPVVKDLFRSRWFRIEPHLEHNVSLRKSDHYIVRKLK
jgi:hypothetical protein